MGPVEIIEFDARFAKQFADLNYQWIGDTYGIEPHDREVLDHPDKIIEADGQIFFAISEGSVAGTVALIPMGADAFELTKMAVDPTFRGRGIGDKLMQACIDHSRQHGVPTIILESNTKQAAAIGLYRKFGFQEVPLDPNSQYARANIRMQLDVSDGGGDAKN
ncbi:MAG TPA: GNAT family N-acetyltransferase [Pyrinomonadaceae bacterium]|nr:GNAT family N-acetyltransferase [Pyrinomonadaceae bacterium]